MTNNTNPKKKCSISFMITLIFSVIMLLGLFLPYFSATEEYKSTLEKHPDSFYSEELNMTNMDAVNVSMIEVGKIYYKGSETFNSQAYQAFYKYYIPISIILIGLFSLLILLCSITKKPILMIILSILILLVFHIMNWDFTDRGIIPGNHYVFGIAYYLYYISTILTFIGSIFGIIEKKKA